jgi:hypothetical protein
MSYENVAIVFLVIAVVLVAVGASFAGTYFLNRAVDRTDNTKPR